MFLHNSNTVQENTLYVFKQAWTEVMCYWLGSEGMRRVHITC